jgi:hypothetical protein
MRRLLPVLAAVSLAGGLGGAALGGCCDDDVTPGNGETRTAGPGDAENVERVVPE